MAFLILARHGNTFEKGTTARWVGARTDMELTAEGEAQGRALAERIAARYAPLGGLMTGPLVRTRRFAEMIAARTDVSFTIDPRLIEIDYGLWENKSSEEIRLLYGENEITAWEKEGQWPKKAGFVPEREKLMRNIETFLDEQREKLLEKGSLNRVAITSNGVLRFVHFLLTGRAAGEEAKVKTGCYGVLAPNATGWSIEKWNEKP